MVTLLRPGGNVAHAGLDGRATYPDLLAAHVCSLLSISELAAVALASKVLNSVAEHPTLWRGRIADRNWRLKPTPVTGTTVAANIAGAAQHPDAGGGTASGIDWKAEYHALVGRVALRREQVMRAPLASWFERQINGLEAVGVLTDGYQPEPWKRRFMVLVSTSCVLSVPSRLAIRG